MKTNYLITLLFTVFVNSSSAQCPDYSPYPVPGPPCTLTPPCGIYIVKNTHDPNLNYQDHPLYYDGIYLKIRWDDLQPAMGMIDGDQWATIRTAFQWAEDNNYKQICIGVSAGENTPAWVIANMGAGNYFTDVINIQGFGSSKCEQLRWVPVPYEWTFINAYNEMMNMLHHMLSINLTANGVRFINMVTMVKLSGINMNSDETRLPVEDRSFRTTDPCVTANGLVYCSDDMVANWISVNYTPDFVLFAWEQIQTHTKLLFNNAYLNVVAIPDPKAFPPIDCNGNAITTGINSCLVTNGCPPTTNGIEYHPNGKCHNLNYNRNEKISGINYGPDYYNLTSEIIFKATNLFSPCLAVNGTFLSNISNTAFLTADYPDLPNYSLIGYQQEHQEYCATCTYWTTLEFQQTISNGIAGLASFIELHPNTVDYFANITPGPNGFANYMDWAHNEVFCYCSPSCRTGSSSTNGTQNNLSIKVIGDVIHVKNDGKNEQGYYEIYDAVGKKIIHEDLLLNRGDNEINIYNLNLSSSLYILKVYCGNNIPSTQKLLVR